MERYYYLNTMKPKISNTIHIDINQRIDELLTLEPPEYLKNELEDLRLRIEWAMTSFTEAKHLVRRLKQIEALLNQ